MTKTHDAIIIGTGRPTQSQRSHYQYMDPPRFMKIMVDAQTHEILGAAILGTGGDEAIHSIRDVVYAKAPYTVIQGAMHIHPTVSEHVPTMLGDLRPRSDGAEVSRYRMEK